MQKLYNDEMEILVNFNDDTPTIDINSVKATIPQPVTVMSATVPAIVQQEQAAYLSKIQELEIRARDLALNNHVLIKDLVAAQAKAQQLESSVQGRSQPPHATEKDFVTDTRAIVMKLRKENGVLTITNRGLNRKLNTVCGQVENLEGTCQILVKEKNFLAQDLQNAHKKIEELGIKVKTTSPRTPSLDFLSQFAVMSGVTLDEFADTSRTYDIMFENK